MQFSNYYSSTETDKQTDRQTLSNKIQPPDAAIHIQTKSKTRVQLKSANSK